MPLHDHIIGQSDLKKTPKEIKIGDTVYGTAPQAAVTASKWLTDLWIQLGRPQTPLTDAGSKLMKVIIAVWEDLYPQESKLWWEGRSEYKKEELDIKTQVHKRTGRSLASYPFPIFMMCKRLFPDFKMGERKNAIKMARRFPMFQMANKI